MAQSKKNIKTINVNTSSDGIKTIEQKYQSMTQEQHILIRPDAYVGDIQAQTESMFVFDDSRGKIIKKNITYVPGLYKIFDEIIVNARDQTEVDKTCDTIMVTVDQEKGEITVYNSGRGIDVEVHAEHNIYVPELIFGKLLTSTNYDDSEARTTGGRNGYGAKLTNIFSNKFEVEIVDFARKRKFYQEFSENMTKRTVAKITELKTCKNGYTKISFIPDFSKFKINGLTNDMVSLIKKRVYDLAGVSNKCKIFYNGSRIEINNFESYIKLYHFNGMTDNDEELEQVDKLDETINDVANDNNDEAYKLFFEKVNENWEVGFMYAPDIGVMEQVSFVNGICTYHGGSHVNYITDSLISILKEMVLKKHKDITIKPNQIKENLIVFLKCTIVNPTFTSQTKETLKSKVSDFGSKCDINVKTLVKFSKSGILNQVVNMIKLKEQAILKKTDGKKVSSLKGIPKLEDANKAGGKESNKCKLILTEGDSAKALAMSGRTVVGSDYYGVFPLKGKLLNVREASAKQLLENEEIINIKKIMGLQHEKDYLDVSSLRYGGIIIMCDADTDGFHIKGLLLNFIHYFWPSLLKIPNFITSLTTPIVKATKGKEEQVFYNIPDYEQWKETNQKGWQIKYYKGLGTSSSKEAKEYFTDIEQKLINYIDDNTILNQVFINNEENDDDEDDEDDDDNDDEFKVIQTNNINENIIVIKPKHKDPCTEAITLAFEKKRADDRKLWLLNYKKNTILDNNQKKVPVGDFINKELIHFSNDDINRSIPSVCDGEKPSQRKVLYGTFLKKLNNKNDEIRVAQLAGYVSEKTCYHHGEASLTGTIVNMAQNYVGSNNINLLYPSGQFGCRILGGKDSASPRYIHTYLGELTRLIFRQEDDPILKYLDDDGTKIEPEYFVPIIPMILVNGTEGIGTGFSTKVPCYDPLTIINNILAMIDDEPIKQMLPWYKNFKGIITQVPDKPQNFLIYGNCAKIDDTHVRVTELPIGTWTTDYKTFLDGLETKGIIKSYVSNNTEEIIDILIEFDDDKLDGLISNNTLHAKLNLINKKSITNMHLYSPEGTIKKYNTPIEILEDFYNVRFDTYIKRKEYLINKLTKELNILDYKMKFIKDILSKNIIIERKKKQEIIDRLIELKYPQLATDSKDESFEYLTGIPLFSLTDEKIKELEDKCSSKEQELAIIKDTLEEDMWKTELNELKTEYIKWLEIYKIDSCKSTIKAKTKNKVLTKLPTPSPPIKAKAKPKAKAKADSIEL